MDRTQINQLINNPDQLLLKQPFIRNDAAYSPYDASLDAASKVNIAETIRVSVPTFTGKPISQSKYLKEYFPQWHDILFDSSLPTIYAKVKRDDKFGFEEITPRRIAIADQKNIHNKRMQYLCGYPTKLSILKINPSDSEKDNFSNFKSRFLERGIDNYRNRLCNRQLMVGDAAILFSFENEKLKAKVLSYREGYVLIPHYSDSGEELLVSIYYNSDDGEYIDSYDNEFMYRWFRSNNVEVGDNSGWSFVGVLPHKFNQIPIIYKRGYVAWEFAESTIEAREMAMNIDFVVKMRHGWGRLYIKGTVKNTMENKLGTVITTDADPDGKGDMKYLDPPSGEAIKDLLANLKKEVEMESSTTFLDSNDINLNSDVSGLALLVLLSKDNEVASQTAQDYQPEIDKLISICTYAFGMEDYWASGGSEPKDKYMNLSIRGQMEVWMPHSASEIISNLVQSKDIISNRTITEHHPYAAADEMQRMEEEMQAEKVEAAATPAGTEPSNADPNKDDINNGDNN